MKAIILAAGRGSRMGGLTKDRPKCKVMLHGQPLIQWQLDALNVTDIDEIALVVGYLSESFELELTCFHNYRWNETNMVVSLMMADELLASDTCIVSYSDIVYSNDAISRLIRTKGDIVVAYDSNWRQLWEMRFTDPLVDAETFRISGDKIVEIGNKASSIEEIEGQYLGVIKLTKQGWNKVKIYLNRYSQAEIDVMDITFLLQGLILANEEIVGVPIKDSWYEVDSESDLKKYSALEKLF